MTELMSIEQVAAYHGVSVGRAYALMSRNSVGRVSGYPADEVKAIPRPGQGARTDLENRLRAAENATAPTALRRALRDVGDGHLTLHVTRHSDDGTEGVIADRGVAGLSGDWWAGPRGLGWLVVAEHPFPHLTLTDTGRIVAAGATRRG